MTAERNQQNKTGTFSQNIVVYTICGSAVIERRRSSAQRAGSSPKFGRDLIDGRLTVLFTDARPPPTMHSLAEVSDQLLDAVVVVIVLETFTVRRLGTVQTALPQLLGETFSIESVQRSQTGIANLSVLVAFDVALVLLDVLHEVAVHSRQEALIPGQRSRRGGRGRHWSLRAPTLVGVVLFEGIASATSVQMVQTLHCQLTLLPRPLSIAMLNGYWSVSRRAL